MRLTGNRWGQIFLLVWQYTLYLKAWMNSGLVKTAYRGQYSFDMNGNEVSCISDFMTLKIWQL